MKSIAFILLLYVSAALAQVSSVIEIQQDSELNFQISIHNKTNSTAAFVLTSSAKIKNLKAVLTQRQQQTGLQFSVLAGQTLNLQYSIPYDTNKTYFKTSEDMWVPVLLSKEREQTFIVKTQTKSGFQFVESATGQKQDGLAFVFGQFTKYQAQDSRLQVYLSKPDEALAKVLLEKLNEYMKRFEADIGAYPYNQFAVVESLDEIGYAFPKMTWMGSQLLRFPFILTTSLPHELLHSWWGNGVYVDYGSGNWCEGLTAFGADYGLLDEEGKKNYRLKALTNYSNYVRGGQELSLSRFVSRGEDRSLQALGYDKAMMIFVMLEQRVGSEKFKKALQLFYQKFKFQKASYEDFLKVLQAVSGQNFEAFEKSWIKNPGSVNSTFLTGKAGQSETNSWVRWTLLPTELQKLSGQNIQVEVNTSTGSKKAIMLSVQDDGRKLKNDITVLPLTAAPLSFVADPNFYLFRNLNELEKPLTFSKLFGLKDIQYRISDESLLSTLKSAFPDKNFVQTSASIDFSTEGNYLMSLDTAISLIEVRTLLQQKGVIFDGSTLTLNGQSHDLNQNSVFLTFRVGEANLTVFRINERLPALRWFQRWSRYGHQSFVILTSTAAAAQGMWLDSYEQSLQ